MAWSTLVTATLWVTCLSLFMLAVGFAIPFWLSFVAGTAAQQLGVYVGVWYSMACIKGESDSCKSKAIKPKFELAGKYDSLKIDGPTQEMVVKLAAEVFGYNAYWWVVQIATTVGIFLVLLATLILICCRCAGIHSKCMFICACVSLFFGGLISLGIAVLTAIVIGVTFSFIDYNVNGETFPWSVLVFGLGGILALVGSIMLMIITCKWRQYGAYEPDDKGSLDDVPMSHVNDAYGRDPYDYRKEYNSYDRTRHGYDRVEPRGYGESRKYDDYRESRSYRDDNRDGYRDSHKDRGYDYDRPYTGQQSTEYLYRGYNQHRY